MNTKYVFMWISLYFQLKTGLTIQFSRVIMWINLEVCGFVCKGTTYKNIRNAA